MIGLICVYSRCQNTPDKLGRRHENRAGVPINRLYYSLKLLSWVCASDTGRSQRNRSGPWRRLRRPIRSALL